MTIYLWKIPEEYPDELIGRYKREISPDRFLFRKGRELTRQEVKNIPVIEYSASKKSLVRFDCLINSSALPIVNKRVADILLENSRKDIQLFDVSIKCSDGELLDYKLANITHSVKAFDSDKSIYSIRQLPRGKTMVANIRQLVFLPNCMGSHQLIRDEITSHILVSKGIKEAFEDKKITGVNLITPDDYYDLIYGRV